MSIDTKQLSEQSQIKTLLATKAILERKLQKIQDENRNFERTLNEERNLIDKLVAESEGIKEDIRKYDAIQIKADDKELLEKIQNLVIKNEELRQQETKFKEQCRQELMKLQKEIALVF